MCVLNVREDYVGLARRVWHTNSNHLTLPVSSAAGKGWRVNFDGVSSKAGTALDWKRTQKTLEMWDRSMEIDALKGYQRGRDWHLMSFPFLSSIEQFKWEPFIMWFMLFTPHVINITISSPFKRWTERYKNVISYQPFSGLSVYYDLKKTVRGLLSLLK